MKNVFRIIILIVNNFFLYYNSNQFNNFINNIFCKININRTLDIFCFFKILRSLWMIFKEIKFFSFLNSSLFQLTSS